MSFYCSDLEFSSVIFGDIIDDGLPVENDKDYFLFVEGNNASRWSLINSNMHNRSTGFTIISEDANNPHTYYWLLYKIHTTGIRISISNRDTGTTVGQAFAIPL